MSEWPKDELRRELMAVAAISTKELAGSEPLDHLSSLCPTLLASLPDVLLGNNDPLQKREQAVRQLLKHTAFVSLSREVRAAGDLLGLSNDEPGNLADMSQENARKIHTDYVDSRGDGPEKFVRFGREVRTILAVRHFGYGITWLRTNKMITEEVLFQCFVDELCRYLDNEDGKLTQLAKDLGYLPTAEVDPATDPLLLSPARAVMDEEKAKQIVREVLGETDEIAVYGLALSLNFDPPLVRAACDYIKADGISVESASSILARDAGIFLDSIAQHRKQPSVTRRLRQAIETLEDEHPRGIRALDFIVFLHHEHISTEYVLAYLLERQCVDLETFEHAALIFDGAIRPLIDAGLLEQDGAFTRMNPLVHSVVRDLRRDRCAEINDRLVSYGFTDLAAMPSARQLMEAEWSPTSIAARWMLDFVLATRLHDELQNRSRSGRDGKLAGANWMLITEALHKRCLEKAAFAWVIFMARYLSKELVSYLEGGAPVVDFLRREPGVPEFHDRFRIFEVEEAVNDAMEKISKLLKNLPAKQEGVDISTTVAPYLQAATEKLGADALTSFNQNDVSTPIGTLRFSDYFPMWEKSQLLAIDSSSEPPKPESS